MSREIKFRGIHTHVLPQNEHLNGRWVYGYFADESYINSPELEGEFLVDKDTVGQYIGVKDKNGREIYEGDIVEHENEIFVVEYADKFASYVLRHPTNMCYAPAITPITIKRMCVIGNVYENADLLKEEIGE